MKRIPIYILLIPLFSIAMPAVSQINPDDIEVGIVEHLGDTLPLDLTFINESNDTIPLATLIDKPTLLNFVYFDCPGICSPLMSGISDVVDKLDMQLGTDYQVLTISFNTKDTPEKALIKKKNFVTKISQENRAHWMYLTGWEDNILAITEAAGFRYKPQGLDFAHPGALILVSPSGRITRYLYGITFLPFDVKMAIIEAQNEQARPTINKVLAYCFAYNPSSKTYTLQITRITGTFILLIAVIVFTILLIKGSKNKLSKTVKQHG